MRRNSLPALAVIGLLLSAPRAGSAPECSDDDAEAADQALGTVVDQLKAKPGSRGAWEKLHLAIRSYRHCDEEETASAFSEAVCHQLAHGWKDAPEIARASRRDAELSAFVLAHLDHSCPAEDLKLVQENAHKRCPRYGKKWCAAVEARATLQLSAVPALQQDE